MPSACAAAARVAMRVCAWANGEMRHGKVARNFNRPLHPMSDQAQPESQTNGQTSNGQQENSQPETSRKPDDSSPANPLQNGHKLLKPSSRLATGLKDRLKVKKGLPGGFDTTPFPDAPQGYTVRFIFHDATNLPVADIATASADPFIHVTLKGTQPKRHKEDPDLTYRTRTIRRSTEPVWEDQWVVANVPPTGFTLKCRLYDEDYPDSDDRLGNVTIRIPQLTEESPCFPPPGRKFAVKKRMGSKRAYFLKGVSSMLHSDVHMTPIVRISMEILGKSDPPFAHMYTVGPTRFVKHFSPLIGRIAGTKVNANEEDDTREAQEHDKNGKKKKRTQKYDFQAIEMQLAGPVSPVIYHRFVEFRPIIASMYFSTGLRGKILNKALHKQHSRIYNFNRSTEYGDFDACSEDAALQFLKLAHFDEGGRIFTYVLTLDGILRFTETGKEFGVDMLSKHTMHSDVATYIACSGEFFIRRLKHPVSSDNPHTKEKAHPSDEISGGPPKEDPPPNPAYYQLIIDNDSGTYRPDKSILSDLKSYLEHNFPGLGIIAMHWEDQELQDLKQAQRTVKKKEGRMINVVMNMSQSSISSAESALDHREAGWEQGQKSKREAAFEALEDPSKMKDAVKTFLPGAK
ncbi:hypothetical protein G7Z17_g6261 [Cylindrodendrum hubeiense]|uniref:C2 domain-containing protein n=1 Tax=Cylindrodendrum hubeiense TaxID=595255 RepID=A0A9P5H7K5_9HYPO|nr:hypothetical protein G7Z17_g6261 [Cylindrodendrum hubeiense]